YMPKLIRSARMKGYITQFCRDCGCLAGTALFLARRAFAVAGGCGLASALRLHGLEQDVGGDAYLFLHIMVGVEFGMACGVGLVIANVAAELGQMAGRD